MGSSKKAHDRLAIEKRKAAWNKTHENALPADVLETTPKPRPRPQPVKKVTSLEHNMDNTKNIGDLRNHSMVCIEVPKKEL